MKNIILYALLLLVLLPLLSGCNGRPLLEGEYSRVEIIQGSELVHEASEAREIEAFVDLINNSNRQETHTWELPEPIGTLSFHGDSEGITLPLYEGGVGVNEYFVEVNFDF